MRKRELTTVSMSESRMVPLKVLLLDALEITGVDIFNKDGLLTIRRDVDASIADDADSPHSSQRGKDIQ